MTNAAQPSATSWQEVVRLRTLPAAVAPVILGAGAAGAIAAFSVPRMLLAAGVALALQIGSNLANDYSDGVRGTDAERTGPPRLTASGLVDPKRVKYAAFGCFGVAGLLGLGLVALSGHWWLLVVGLAAVAAAWFYTGGSHPYGYAGWGEVFVFVFFGLVATVGTTYVQAGFVPAWLWLAACGIGLIACCLLMVNNLRDIDTDPKHGKRTLAVRLGESRARHSCSAMLLAALGLGALSLVWAGHGVGQGWAVMVGALVGFLVPSALMTLRALRPVRSGARGRALIEVLRQVGVLELIYGLGLAGALLVVTH